MKRFNGSIIYNEETVTLLDATLQRTFYYWRRYVIFAICIVFLGIGLQFGINNIVGLICIVIGCLIAPYAANYVIPGPQARMSINAIKGKKILLEYNFNNFNIICKAGKNVNTIKYDKVVRLIDHEDFYYICTDITQACMVDKRSIEPNDQEAFKDFISEKCDLKWTKQPSVLSLNFRTIKFNRANTKLERKDSSK